MAKLLQINVTANWGSTGKIAEQIGQLAMKSNWESYIAYGRYCNPSESHLIKIGNQLDVYEHYVENVLLDNEGLASRRSTKSFVEIIKKLRPDIIQLHNIHDHYLNYFELFVYLSTTTIPVVWTQHDCWAFTGGCHYYSIDGCTQYQKECIKCLKKKKLFVDRTNRQYNLKKKLFLGVNNLTVVPVSRWLEKEVKKSFLCQFPVYAILNGVDLSVFKPRYDNDLMRKYNLQFKHYVIGVASKWDERKNLKDYLALATLLPDVTIVIVGLPLMKRKGFPSNLIVIPRTQSANDLAVLYTGAFAVLNLSSVESFGLTTVEGLACGTPGIVYNCTASPELVTPDTGVIIEQGNINVLKETVLSMKNGSFFHADACRKRAVEFYDKDKCYEKYIRLYQDLSLK